MKWLAQWFWKKTPVIPSVRLSQEMPQDEAARLAVASPQNVPSPQEMPVYQDVPPPPELADPVAALQKQALAYQQLGQTLLSEKRPLAAMELFAKCRDIQEQLGHQQELAATCVDIAQTYLQLNRADKAIENLQKASVYLQSLGDRAKSATISRQLAELCLREGRPNDAHRYYHEALPYYRQHGMQTYHSIIAKLEELETDE